MKTLVTHRSPDLDAITSIWLIVRNHYGWDQPHFEFVLAGKTLNDAHPDDNATIIHVDTGLGKFDHHQLEERTSASRRILDFLKEKGNLRKSSIEALDRIVDVVTLYDNFGEAKFHEPQSDIYNFSLSEVINGTKAMLQDDLKTVEMVLPFLDGLLYNMKNKIGAEKDLKMGLSIQTSFGKSLFLETSNDESMKLAMKIGYNLVIRKDPDRGYVRIKTFPDPEYDLTKLYNKIMGVDKVGSWFLHSSKNMLLNGSSKSLDMKASPLTLAQLIELIREM
jgi:hypothetical protein